MSVWKTVEELDEGTKDLLVTIVSVAALLAVLAVLTVWIYNYATLGVCTNHVRMDNKTVIITGSNSGIGKETALELARRGAKIIMACRNLEQANKVRDSIVEATKNNNIVVKKLDLSSLASVRAFAEEVNRTERRLDVLIHNAGMANTFSKQKTADGLEVTMATNQFGPFLLTHLLIDLLKRSAPSRVVVVASSLYRLASVNINNPNPVNTLPAYLYYSSKYANILFTRELARRLEGTGVTANCLHPGLIDSGIWRNVPVPLSWGLKLIIKGFFKTPEQGAQTSIYLATSPEVEGVNGKYFSDCKMASLSRGVEDMALAKKYWEICEELVQLKSSDPRI
ncbi:retinol dehydrogenase 14 [Macrosteles quadrilineatus]|uniref:retinol dehydrogenase 14 n=1 Tax=Macrosteles quadrilineatus TaxID=74068 RepID=UPI0023E26EDD|nr:retinol dehydrogenase 14 [Macrosteles quadrilineatus]